MGSVSDVYDNAMAESCFATLECELNDRRGWMTKPKARMALFTCIEYNPRRRRSAVGQISPPNCEQPFADQAREQQRSTGSGIPTVGVRVAGVTPRVDIPYPMTAEVA
jgi:putative transposase